MAEWTWIIDNVSKNHDGLTVSMTYTVTNGVETEQITEARVPSKESCVQVCENAIAYRNRVQKQLDDLAALDTSMLIGDRDTVIQKISPTHEPTQDEIDLAAFQAAMAHYIEIEGIYTAAQNAKTTTKITLADVQQAYSDWKATYIHEEYGKLIPKDFPYQ